MISFFYPKLLHISDSGKIHVLQDLLRRNYGERNGFDEPKSK